GVRLSSGVRTTAPDGCREPLSRRAGVAGLVLDLEHRAVGAEPAVSREDHPSLTLVVVRGSRAVRAEVPGDECLARDVWTDRGRRSGDLLHLLGTHALEKPGQAAARGRGRRGWPRRRARPR